MIVKLKNCIVESSFNFLEQGLGRKQLYSLNLEISYCQFRNSSLKLFSTDLKIFNSTAQNTTEIRVYGRANVTISNCLFKNKFMLIMDCKLTFKIGHVVTIFNTTFINTKSKTDLLFVSNYLQFRVIYCTFKGFQNTAIRLIDVKHFNVTRSVFKNNKGIDGGALQIIGCEGVIGETVFVNNTGTRGGAIFYERCVTKLLIKNSKFISNSAMSQGGSIYIENPLPPLYLKSVELHNVTLYGGPISPLSSSVLIYSTAFTIFWNVTMRLSSTLPNWPMTEGFSCHVKCIEAMRFKKQDFTYRCPENHNVALFFEEYGRYKLMAKPNVEISAKAISTLRCVRCKKLTYTINEGNLHILRRDLQNNTISNNGVICQKCPPGGKCDNGIISRGNFWGYPMRDIVTFTPCPPSYCCSPGNSKCVSYNTCNNNREGVLCGSCKTGYRVNFFDDSCISKQRCWKRAFWLLYIFYAIIYTGILLYYKNVFLYVLKYIKSSKKTKDNQGSLLEPLLDNSEFDMSDEEEEGDSTVIISTVSTQEELCTTSNWNAEVGMVQNISGIKTILFFFYQIEVLLRINNDDHQKKTVLGNLKKAISSVFNLQIIFVPLSKLCPSENLTKVGKEVVKLSTIPTAMVFLVLAFVIREIYLAWKTRQREDPRRETSK